MLAGSAFYAVLAVIHVLTMLAIAPGVDLIDVGQSWCCRTIQCNFVGPSQVVEDLVKIVMLQLPLLLLCELCCIELPNIAGLKLHLNCSCSPVEQIELLVGQ